MRRRCNIFREIKAHAQQNKTTEGGGDFETAGAAVTSVMRKFPKRGSNLISPSLVNWHFSWTKFRFLAPGTILSNSTVLSSRGESEACKNILTNRRSASLMLERRNSSSRISGIRKRREKVGRRSPLAFSFSTALADDEGQFFSRIMLIEI